MIFRGKASKLLFGILILFSACQSNTQEYKFHSIENSTTIEIGNDHVKAIFSKSNEGIEQVYYAKKSNEWIEVAASFKPPKDFPEEAVQLFNVGLAPEHRFLVNSLVSDFKLDRSEHELAVTLTGESGDVPVTQIISLRPADDYFHFDVSLTLSGSPPKLDYALSVFTFNLERAPEFVHTPGLKFDNEDSKQNRFELLPGKDQVIGDRAFHAPAVILQESGLFAALVPDLNVINQFRITSPDARRTTDIPVNKFTVPLEEDKFTMPTGLDFNVMTGLTAKPVMTFGYMDNIIAHHIRYQRVNDGSMIRTLDSNKVRYAFDLFVNADEPRYSGFQKIANHQWEEFGRPVFKGRSHLAMPVEEYFNIIDSITFNPIKSELTEIDLPLDGYKDTGSWLEWEEDGQKIGGYRSAIGWWNDVMHNSAFWNNAREAQGFWYWGERLNRPDLKEKARSIINWCLSAPRNTQGLFALLYRANEKKWGLSFTDPVNEKNVFFLKESDSYDISTMSKTAAHMLDYHLRCEKDQRIVDYLTPYGNWLLTVIDEKGAVPSYVDQKNMQASTVLHYSAQPASSMWFLAELYNVTNEQKYLDGAREIAAYLENEVLPEQKWVDMEQFFSCGNRPFEFTRDRWQNQVARGNLALFWAIEGFAALYRATDEDHVLKLGEKCVDYVTFTQACWDPHFIYTAFPFGGFSVDNADNATFLDARQAEMVRPFIWYGMQLSRQDLIERGVAAARSSVVLINHPRHKSNNIYRHTNIYPYGLGPENIDHEAHPQSAMRTHPSWGEGSGVFTGLAEAGRGLGGIYVDFEKNLNVGVDGLRIESANREGNEIHLKIVSMLALLDEPWDKEFSTELKIVGLSEGDYKVILNDVYVGDISIEKGQKHWINIQPDGEIKILTGQSS